MFKNLYSLPAYLSTTVFLLFLFPALTLSQDLQRYDFQSRHMGSQVQIMLYSASEEEAENAANSAFDRIEEINQSMSDYIDESELNRLSRLSGSGEWMEISPSFFDVLKMSVWISRKTDGLFDVTIGPMTHTWRYIRRLPDPELPDKDEIKSMQKRVGFHHIELDEENLSARLMADNMQLDFGGIAKGYAAEEAVRVINSYGIHSVLVDAGGDISAGDPPPGRSAWDVAVPKGGISETSDYITLSLSGKTLTTSGDMYQFMEIDGTRYSHIINPKTGIGSADQIQATVISSNGMYADAFASVLTMMAPEDGIELIEKFEETEAILFMEENGEIREWRTSGISEILK
ncbi:FAD:protein FMN transferase [Rhodohalobacter sp. SW132]|uniref:FAD:protein FMN transferase n=1 Tax=Rhodohalobacter sp. SW132 TaxID=2293433 RepID=UPI000E21F2F9|nr:FAD:protein FMN transferase [Rhodohalobacter sp. SW132]REL39044.1 FAD:protein FMN transferase [Rhodohalobacter sp. SW132]